MEYIKLHIKIHLQHWWMYLWLIPLAFFVTPIVILTSVQFGEGLMGIFGETLYNGFIEKFIFAPLIILMFGTGMSLPLLSVNKKIALSYKSIYVEPPIKKITLINHLVTVVVLSVLGLIGIEVIWGL